MILSVSRRTDIPSYYSDWFFNRIRDGYFYVRNPLNPRQLSEIQLSPETVDCIVFWTKNPQPMMARLSELEEYPFYFQFTLTGYGKEIESRVPHKKHVMIPVFQQLSRQIGKERVIWRYDPILFTDVYTMEYHLQAFRQISESLRGYTDHCVISFVDTYAKNRKKMKELHVQEPEEASLKRFAGKLAEIARENEMTIGSCAETIDLRECGIEQNCCIDKERIEKIIGCRIRAGKDKNQRSECGCVESVEVGTYNTCLNGCVYCYANAGDESVRKNSRLYDPDSPILCGAVREEDRISVRKVSSLKERQMTLEADGIV
ncbi:MAG: DUF1848 family protein [Lachnospiraceae bacterium]|nr:DUF1848 family protein [Lachnospiraceae bacterium]